MARLLVEDNNRRVEEEDQRTKALIRATNPDLFFAIWPARQERTLEDMTDYEGKIHDIQGDIVPDMSPEDIFAYFENPQQHRTITEFETEELEFGDWQ